jgi:antibiotic biosynthesis monooxygenase (ABM) superfamily enzyme
MYGTVALLKFDPANKQALIDEQAEQEASGVDGFISADMMLCDAPGEAILVVRFRDKESYVANADSPEQNQRYTKWRALLTADPEWHDGEWQ